MRKLLLIAKLRALNQLISSFVLLILLQGTPTLFSLVLSRKAAAAPPHGGEITGSLAI